jgi:hypothetical protein
MRITITKGERSDRIEAERPDGSSIATDFPHKGPIPHDVSHYIVETELGIADGFWGLVGSGRHPDEIAGLAKAAGHASAKRASVPAESIVGIVQAERAVECFEADLWCGASSEPETLREMIATGSDQSLVPPIDVSDDAIGRIRGNLSDFANRWAALKPGESLSLEWTSAA